MKVGTSDIILDFSDFSDGLNTKDAHTAIGAKQAYRGSKNARFGKRGFAPWFGFRGISGTATFAAACKGVDIYSRVSGTDTLIAYSGGGVYSINTVTNEATPLYTLGGTGECYGVSFYDKFFVANGTASCVIEGTSAYPIGIAPPTGVVAAAVAGGTLPDGVYAVYASYARTVSGANVLYSVGQSVGSVVLGGGNNSIAISSFANSADGRVGNKVIFCTDADEEVIYLYHQTGDNTTTSFAISSDTGRNADVLYRIVAAASKQPPTMTGLFSHDDRLFGWCNNVLYASKQAVTVYDLERWPDIQYEFPYRILGLFAIGADLYLSTVRGIIKLPDGDMAASYEHITKRMWFKHMRTVDNVDENSEENPSPVIGVTNDGVRIFDGIRFSKDVSISIKDRISNLYSAESATFPPCGIVYRSYDRTEYRVSYRDLEIGSAYNNTQYVLNLDRLSIANDAEFSAPWERLTIGFQYACINSSNIIFMAQSSSGASQILSQVNTAVTDKWVYDGASFLTAATAKNVVVVSQMVVPDIAGRIEIEQFRGMSYLLSPGARVKVQIGDSDVNETMPLFDGANETARFDSAFFDLDHFSSDNPCITVQPAGENIKGVAVYIEFSCPCVEVSDYIAELKLYAKYIQGVYA